MQTLLLELSTSQMEHPGGQLMTLLNLFTDDSFEETLCWHPLPLVKNLFLHLVQPSELHYLQLGSEQAMQEVPDG